MQLQALERHRSFHPSSSAAATKPLRLGQAKKFSATAAEASSGSFLERLRDWLTRYQKKKKLKAMLRRAFKDHDIPYSWIKTSGDTVQICVTSPGMYSQILSILPRLGAVSEVKGSDHELIHEFKGDPDLAGLPIEICCFRRRGKGF